MSYLFSRKTEPRDVEWTQGPVFDSEIRVDITIVTSGKIFYQLDVHLKLIAKYDVSKLLNFDIVCHGFHSDVLVLGSEDGRIHILELKRQKHNSISFSPHFCGDIGLFDRSGHKTYGYRAEGNSYIHSVSIHHGKVLAATHKTVYIWKTKNQRPSSDSSLTTFPLKSNDVLWACLDTSRRKLYDPTTWITKPYLVGKCADAQALRTHNYHLGFESTKPEIWVLYSKFQI
ncbi:hypothetical protein BKA61DRAFT_581539 [Leptodontidium sp. MPI-SDFR-AT-0119]|nr:hypothetical protein BKA61DRAFT_581539 [Leptodontidium sp. MPI-SDFR-AT-0119]